MWEPSYDTTGYVITRSQQGFNVDSVVDTKSDKRVKYKMENQFQAAEESED